MRNAVEAMQGAPRRELRVATAARSDGMAEVSVVDTGPGLAPEVSAQLFQPFVTTKKQGMGVGLSICRTIVESHGGHIWAEPMPGGGTAFRFTLRVVEKEEVANGR
jgi:two-component system sensor kinase FixL